MLRGDIIVTVANSTAREDAAMLLPKKQTESLLVMLHPRIFSYQMYVPTEPAPNVAAKDLPL